jgi:hypothetical protein
MGEAGEGISERRGAGKVLRQGSEWGYGTENRGATARLRWKPRDAPKTFALEGVLGVSRERSKALALVLP